MEEFWNHQDYLSKIILVREVTSTQVATLTDPLSSSTVTRQTATKNPPVQHYLVVKCPERCPPLSNGYILCDMMYDSAWSTSSKMEPVPTTDSLRKTLSLSLTVGAKFSSSSIFTRKAIIHLSAFIYAVYNMVSQSWCLQMQLRLRVIKYSDKSESNHCKIIL